ncbi:MAG: hypothetical protein NVS9B3_05550 [Gemmatimonadaceae bacterium]
MRPRMQFRGLFALVMATAGCAKGKASQTRAEDTTATVTDGCTDAVPLTVTAGGIGTIKLGSSLLDIAARCAGRDTVVMRSEGTRERGRVLRAGGHSVIVLATSAKGGDTTTISRIVVADGAFRTDHGVGVGSSVGELRKAHGQLCAALAEGSIVVNSAALPGVSFATSASTALVLRGGPRALERDPGLVPDSAKVTTLWIDDREMACGGS